MEKTLLSIALILIATKVCGIISKKLKMPEVLGALVAGVLLGPMVFHLVSYTDNIKLLADIGVIFLMFLAGIETNIDQMKASGKSASLIAILGVVLPLVTGAFFASFFSDNLYESIFIGIVLSATSVSITVETLTELGKLNTRVGINVLGAAVIDDILGLLLISVLLATNSSGGVAGGSLAFTLIKIALFCGVSLLAIAIVPKYLNKYLKAMEHSRTLVTFVIAGILVIAFFAEELGIAAITGAYLFGLLLSKFVHKEYIERNIKAMSAAFLSPIFFASVGLDMVSVPLSFTILEITVILSLVAILGKLIGCGLGARLFKMSKQESIQVGIGMISRGEVAIITANIGLQNKIISETIFIPVILIVLVTTIVTPILLKKSFSHKYDPKPTLDATTTADS